MIDVMLGPTELALYLMIIVKNTVA